MRIIKLIRVLPSLNRTVVVMMKTIDSIAPFFILLSFFLYIFSLLGMNLFGCRFCVDTLKPKHSGGNPNIFERSCQLLVVDIRKKKAINASDTELVNLSSEVLNPQDMGSNLHIKCPRSNFDNLLSSIFTVMQIITQDGWSQVLREGIRATSPWAAVYFIIVVTVGNYVIFNLLVAILVEGFATVCFLPS